MAPVSTDSQGGSARGSRLDSPPPLPPSLSDKRAPDLASANGPGGTPPTGELAQVVLEHAQLVEQLLTSLGRMLPAFVPVAAQIQASMRVGVVTALRQSMTQPSQSLAAGAGPSAPPQMSGPGAGSSMPPPPGGQSPTEGAGAAPPVQ